MQGTNRKIKTITIGSVTLLFVLVIGLIMYFFLTNNAKSQLNEFEKAVHSKDYSKVSEFLSSKEVSISSEEAERFVDFVSSSNNKTRFNRQIDQIKSNIDKDNSVNFGYLTDKNGRKLVKVSMNGKQFFFIDRLAFKPILKSVYIKNNSISDAKYRYTDMNHKKQVVTVKQGELAKLGEFFAGKHNINAERIYDEENSLIQGEDHGNIWFDMDSINKNNKIIADDDFEETYFKVNISNEEKLKSDISLSINDNDVEYKNNKVYGSYPSDKPIEVYAKSKIGDTIIKTNTIDVNNNVIEGPQTINLKFNKDDLHKLDENENKKKNSAKSFMRKYTEYLNKAYKKKDFNIIENYFENNTALAKHMQTMVESNANNEYGQPEFKDIEYRNEEVTIILEKKNQKNIRIKSKYKLKYNKADDDFIIQSYEDI
ncbi:hypothetical protein O0H38_07505 [Staphylococcus pseudintermedius]|nr:hypothetical protein [Staphylococcus pseudintermedius]